VACAGLIFAAEYPTEPLPEPVSDNAVAILKIHGQFALFSLMGIGPKKTSDAVTNVAYELDAASGKAYTIHSVPGTAGRIAAMAVGVSGHVLLFGGYVLYQGGGMAVQDANIYEPAHDRWVRAADIPTAVGDAVIGTYRERYIYLIGGRSNARLVSDVQMFDLEKNRWSKATPMPGSPVFGHAGAVVGDTIIYVDGARSNEAGAGPRFVASDECWKGRIDHHNPARIEWTKLPAHPGNARFRIAAGGSEKDDMIYFSGGSDTPHDYTGVGYDGKPSEPSPVTFAFDLRSGKWEMLNDKTPDPTMDHRGLLVTPEGLVIIGGMEKGQQVTGKIAVLSKVAKK
jgi:N-acetylneuraminic acid mutarotase